MYRINELIKTGKNIFSIKDLALIWNIKKDNTLYTTLKRYVKKGLLFRIKKGIYSITPIEKLSIVEIASALVAGYHYLSCETVLQKEGIIFQSSNQLTFVSNKSLSLKFKDYIIKVRQMKDRFLYNKTGIYKDKNGVLTADCERAIADMLYFNKNYYFDNKNIDWKKVKSYQLQIGYTK